ncbi:MAG: hypothetical protein ABIR81_01050 [Ginsengibacter sp.]
MNRKILACIFLLIIIIPLSYTVSLAIKKLWVKHEMLEALEQRHLRVITTTIDLVKWVEQDEVIIEGRHFDVKSFKTSGESITLKGLFDHEEDLLALEIDQCYNPDDKNSTTGETYALVLLLQPLLLQEDFSLSHFSLKALLPFIIGSSNILQQQKFVDTPPPKSLFYT